VSVYVKQLRLEEADKVAGSSLPPQSHNIEAQRVYLQVLVFNAENLETAVPLARKLLRRPRTMRIFFI
jgi:hypothetical protein